MSLTKNALSLRSASTANDRPLDARTKAPVVIRGRILPVGTPPIKTDYSKAVPQFCRAVARRTTDSNLRRPRGVQAASRNPERSLGTVTRPLDCLIGSVQYPLATSS